MSHGRAVPALIVCVIAIAACGRRTQPVAAPTAPPPVVQETPPPPPTPVADAPTTPATPAALTEEEIFARKTLDELNAEKPLADAFFDFDQWHVREDARTSLQKNAEWLRRWLTGARSAAPRWGWARGRTLRA